jgi:3-oxoacyl-[acyl-carrier protein] reductase
MTTSLDLTGKNSLVTGGGRGIGRAIALELAAAGSAVALIARSTDELHAVAAEIRAAGGTAVVLPADLADPLQVSETAKRAADELGPIDILINNAAVIWPAGPSTEIDPAQWAAAIGVNLTAVATLSFALLPSMIERGWGRVINISSGVAARPELMLSANAYATSKVALEAHTVNLAAEFAGSGVTINAYRPGGVDTAMQDWIRDQDPAEIGEDLHSRFVEQKATGVLISPAESVAPLMLRLASEQTGQVWDVSDQI